MKVYGLIGYPLGHSFSKKYFSEKFLKEKVNDSRYENYPLDDINKLTAVINDNPDLRGLNVTIPYKQDVIAFLSEMDVTAETIGAVNCIKIYRDGEHPRLKGYNTDVIGFRESLLNMIGNERPRALVFGTGGASKAVLYGLKELGIDYKVVSRKKREEIVSYDDVTEETIKEFKLLINTTPLGTFPETQESVEIPYDAVTNEHFLYDLVYNPAETEFLRKGRIKGAMVKNGYEMLILQAEAGYKIFCE
ncbi:MAG: shikimate dehydrogenase [Rikenellaceae bacterium]|nr:shikimate dehydrogenase [Rikenellaceae bacterium]